MFYLIPISILAYKHRASIGYYLIRTVSYMEILYNRWYNMCYLHPDYKLFINGKQIIDKNEIQSNSSSENDNDNDNELIYEIEYTYKNKMYRLIGNKLEKLLNYLENINEHMDITESNSKKIYKWISSFDEDGKCYLDLVKKYGGPLGDFYTQSSNELEIFTNNISWLKGKKIVITDFRLDEYVLNGTIENERIKLTKMN
jgi:hypothetical protein